jgi:Tfp pilus assembly protein PilZ
MSIATLARGARQSLGRGLEALQAPDTPPGLAAVAQPLARAMQLLVAIETAPEARTPAAALPALEALREGLRLLQLPENVQLPAAERGMAAVAQALGSVREINESLERSGGTSPAAAARTSTELSALPSAASGKPMRLPQRDVPFPGRTTVPEPKLVDAPESGHAVPASGPRRVLAELGVHSPTNFYKGLSGGDVIASGGLFVATYQVPEIGEPVLLTISMPGGYEFEARAVVAWTRNVHQSTSAAMPIPGFGARFSEITDEGRALVQRYVRNREPLFHDDV